MKYEQRKVKPLIFGLPVGPEAKNPRRVHREETDGPLLGSGAPCSWPGGVIPRAGKKERGMLDLP